MSGATVDRLLINTRAATTNRRRPAALSAVRRSNPIKTFADWKEPIPEFMEADLVGHCGDVNADGYVNTLTPTDVSSEWTECSAVVVRKARVVVEFVERLREEMPSPLRGLDTDNGTEFMSDVLWKYCASHGIEFTRSRTYRKNDQAWVEQKNGSVVRRLVGFRRLQGLAAAAALSRLYAASRIFVNSFQPSVKLISKTRVGARVKKRYDLPIAPYARLLASSDVSVEMKNRLREVEKTLDPLRLLEEIRAIHHHLVALSDRSSVHTPPERDKDLTQFLADLSGAWRAGEVRPTHEADLPKIRDWRTRKDPFETAWPTILSWLESEPDQTGTKILQRLKGPFPAGFPDGQLRTLQRRIKIWRAAAARRLFFGVDANPMFESRLAKTVERDPSLNST